jgi:hypothetical protein
MSTTAPINTTTAAINATMILIAVFIFLGAERLWLAMPLKP